MIFLTSDEKFDGVINLELGEIIFAKFAVDLSCFDALVLTSKNSVSSLKFNEILPLKTLQIYAISHGTAAAAKSYGFERIYTASNAHGNDFANEIAPLLKAKSVLFLKAKITASNVAEILTENEVKLTEIIAYENLAKKLDFSQKPPKNSVIIFTAPSNVKRFIANFGWDKSFKAVSIGETTAKWLKNFTTPIISQSQNLTDCVNLAKALF